VDSDLLEFGRSSQTFCGGVFDSAENTEFENLENTGSFCITRNEMSFEQNNATISSFICKEVYQYEGFSTTITRYKHPATTFANLKPCMLIFQVWYDHFAVVR